MKFIRKNGRVIPIRDRIAQGVEKGALPGALVVGAYHAAELAATNKKFNPFGVVFWGLKGAVAGGILGGVASAPWSRGVPKVSEKNKQELTGAFKRSLTLGSIGSLALVAKPFLRNPRAKGIANAAFRIGHLGATANAVVSAARAEKGNKGKTLAAGAAGDVLSANLLRLAKPVLRNRARLGLRRIG